MTILSSFTHPHVVLNLKIFSRNVEVNGHRKTFWLLTFFKISSFCVLQEIESHTGLGQNDDG